jgi:prephenate dehydrogenase
MTATAPTRWTAPPLGRLAVVGVGQIGGSVALAARAAGAVSDVVGFGRSAETLARALSLGIIDRVAASPAEAAHGAALVVLATPVGSLGSVAAAVAPALGPEALVLDVGSIKAAAIRAVAPHLPAARFVACHPLAGTERFGPDAASAALFDGRPCVICPTAETSTAAVATVERLWAAMGAQPLRMDAALHDRVLGAASHLPHVAAYALAAALGRQPAELTEALRRLATTSLRDTTRVAASSPEMWRDILLDNRAELLPLIDALAGEIAGLRAAVASGDGARLLALLDGGKNGRDRIVPA